MKKLKIYKSALALVTATSILLLCGCSSAKKENKEKLCTHLTVYFDDNPITFKECEGYVIDYVDGHYASNLFYTVKKADRTILDGVTLKYDAVDILHSVVDQELDIESIQKSK